MYEDDQGYIILMIFVGAFLGALVFQWDTFNSSGYSCNPLRNYPQSNAKCRTVEQKEACC